MGALLSVCLSLLSASQLKIIIKIKSSSSRGLRMKSRSLNAAPGSPALPEPLAAIAWSAAGNL